MTHLSTEQQTRLAPFLDKLRQNPFHQFTLQEQTDLRNEINNMTSSPFSGPITDTEENRFRTHNLTGVVGQTFNLRNSYIEEINTLRKRMNSVQSWN